MDRLEIRLDAAKRALTQFNETLEMPFTTIVRDATIQRFEFTFEACWKVAQHYLREKEGIDVNSPKAVARASLQQGLLSEKETHHLLKMADDRNLTVHVYNEPLAAAIFKRLPEHFRILKMWVEKIENRLEKNS